MEAPPLRHSVQTIHDQFTIAYRSPSAHFSRVKLTRVNVSTGRAVLQKETSEVRVGESKANDMTESSDVTWWPIKVRPCPESSHSFCMKGSWWLGPACSFRMLRKLPVCSEPVLLRYESQNPVQLNSYSLIRINLTNSQTIYIYISERIVYLITILKLQRMPPLGVRFCSGTSRLMSLTSKSQCYLSTNISGLTSRFLNNFILFWHGVATLLVLCQW